MAKRKRKRKRKGKADAPAASPEAPSLEAPADPPRPEPTDGLGLLLARFSQEFSQPASAALLLVVLAVMAYFLSLWVPFLFDDAPVVTRNRMLWSWSGAWELLKFKPTRYLTNMTFLVNVKLAHWGTVPPIQGGIRYTWTYHVYSIGTHALNGVLLFTLVRDLLRARQGLVPTRLINLVALVSAAVWVAHPANTMAVAYIAQRYALMAGLVVFGTVIVYVRLRIRMEARGSTPLEEWPRYALVLAGVVLALTTKENAAILPLLLVVIELLIFGGRQLLWTAVFFLPHVLGALLIVLAYGLDPFLARFLPSKSPTSTRFEYFVTQIPVTLRYVHLWILPHDLTVEQAFPVLWDSAANQGQGDWFRMKPSYAGQPLGPTQAPRLVALALLGHALLLGFAAKLFARGHRLIPLAIAWFYVMNIVESSIIPILDPMVDHRMYVPLALFPAAFAVAVTRSLPTLEARWSQARTVVGAGAMILVLVLAGGTVARVTTWMSPTGIWRDTLEKRPDCARAWSSLGMEHLYAQDWMGAVGPIENAVRLGPYHVEGWNNLGKAYLELGQWKAAEEALLEGIKIHTISPSKSVRMCWNNVGLVYLNLSKEAQERDEQRMWLEKAHEHLDRAIELDPLYETAYSNKANAAFLLMQLARNVEERTRYAQSVYEAVLRERQVAEMRGYELRLGEHRKLAFALLELDQAEEALYHLLSLEKSFSKGSYRVAWLNLIGELALGANTPAYAGGPKAKNHETVTLEACKRIDAELQGGGAAELLITRAELADILGERQQALRLYQEGIKANPAHPRLKKARQRVLELSGG